MLSLEMGSGWVWRREREKLIKKEVRDVIITSTS